MSVAVPLCNSLALVCTTVTAAAIGEHVAKPLYVVLGIGFILAGKCTCCVFANENMLVRHDSTCIKRACTGATKHYAQVASVALTF
jgi:hypothetical protein